ncbi:MAG: protein-glutamate O-methyltransferase CheR [Desulfobacterales bacterium]|nr:protein-glutamate O-methyltransferase CheR [Desulfobacterales bacterium]
MNKKQLVIKDLVQLKPEESKLFQKLVYDSLGISMDERKNALIQNRLRKRLILKGMPTYGAYYKYIINPVNKDELKECLNLLTTNETFFFRHKEQWDFFTKVFIPEWAGSYKVGSIIRIWSAACSTGAEAYSAGIALLELLPKSKNFQISIEGTDINEKVIEYAKKALYDEYALQKLTKECVKKYFKKDKESVNYLISEQVKKVVYFRQHNLMNPILGPPFDLIFLRNVMIYFDDKSKEVVLKNVSRRIKPGGYLILGGAETLSSYEDLFTFVKPSIYRRRKN